jgi:hypothetical protein
MPLERMSDPYLKTARAKVHLDALREELGDFSKSKPHRVHRQRDTKNQRYIIRLEIKPVPEFVPLIVGDFLGCLRASLDHLVWQLAQANKPSHYPEGTEFPIMDAPNGKRLRDSTRRVATEARRMIETFQPYYGRQHDMAAIRSHLLWRLNTLCIIDKHRRIPVHSDFSRADFPDFPQESWHLAKRKTLNNAYIVSVPLHLEDKMRLDPATSFKVIFGDSFVGVECDTGGLEDMYNFVTDKVLPRFARFFK